MSNNSKPENETLIKVYTTYSEDSLLFANLFQIIICVNCMTFKYISDKELDKQNFLYRFKTSLYRVDHIYIN